jgi:DNA-binding transcriptional LysR family regulator
MVLGAAAGLLFGYLFLTDHGRQFRERLGPMLDTWNDELRRLRETADKARSTINEGRDSFAAMRRVTHAPRKDSY